MKQLKILLISHDFTVTGAPNSLLRQAKYFKSAGHEVDIWSLGGGGLLPRYIEAGFSPIIIENRAIVIDSIFRNMNKKYDFILCNTIVTYKAVKVLSQYNTPVVWFVRETQLVDMWMESTPKFAALFKKFYNIYTVSPYAARVLKKYNKNVRIIKNAIEDLNPKVKPTGGKIVFGYIGSIIEVKGVDFLIDAFVELSKQNKNIELRIAGNYDNPYGQELRQKTKDIKNIIWVGEVQCAEKCKFFDGIDVLCVPSLDEPCALTVIEGAMASKVLIASENTGGNYVIKNGSNGYIVKTADSTSLMQAMADVCKADIDAMKAASRQMYLKHGTTSREKRDVLRMLHDNLDNRPPNAEKLPRIFSLNKIFVKLKSLFS